MNKKISATNIIFLLIILISVPVSIFLLGQKTSFFNRASGTTANISIDASNFLGGKSESWRYLAQGGEEKGRQLPPVIDKVKVLRPKYIRIDHVFDYYTPDELDQIIRDITQTGARPFISLSYMPNNLARNGDVTSMPNNWSEWENLVTKTVERISGRNGLNIDEVYYEVWNEPDLFGKFKYYGDKNYLELYKHTALAIKRANNVNNLKVGGPATTAFYSNWTDALITYTVENNLTLDFISWHRYSKDMSVFEDDYNSTQNYPNLEKIITESGPNSENDKVYDTNQGAIHLISLIATLEGKVDKVFTFEIKDGVGSEKYWGRWGILTNEKWGTPEIKPRYRAFEFLNNLIGSSNIKVEGNGSWVKALAKRSDQKVQILIVNYDQYGTHSENVPLKILNLPSNSFNLKRIDFGGGVNTEQIEVQNNMWETTLMFNPNTASILELSF
jgi:hypothetical protein